MKQFRFVPLTFIIAFTAIYLSCAFVKSEIDFRQWSESGRLVFLLAGGLGAAFIAMSHVGIIMEINKPYNGGSNG